MAPVGARVAASVPLAVGYTDLAAAERGPGGGHLSRRIFARVGLPCGTTAGMAATMSGYSLFAPALGALVGEQLLLGLSAIAAAGLFGLIVERVFGVGGARAAAVPFALGACGGDALGARRVRLSGWRWGCWQWWRCAARTAIGGVVLACSRVWPAR